MTKPLRWFGLAAGIALLGGSPLSTGVLLGQRLPEYFRHYQAFKESGNLVRAVHKNRLTVLIEEHPSGDLALVTTHFGVGRLDPPSGLAEIAGGLAEQSLAESLDKVGALVSLEVGEAMTSVNSVVPVQDLSEALRAHARLFGLSETGWELESARVEEAKRERTSRAAFGRRQALLGLVNPPEAGARESGPDGDQVSRFLRRHYRPEGAILSVTGTVRREVVLPRVGREMDELELPLEPDSKIPPAVAPVEAAGEFRYREIRGEGERRLILVAFPLPGRMDDPALRLLRAVLAEGYTSLLGIPREGEEGRVLLARSGIEAEPSGSVLWFEIDPGNATLEAAETRLFTMLRALENGDVPQPFLDRGKALLLTDWYGSQETLEGRALALASSEAAGDFAAKDRYPERLRALSAKDLREVVGRYLTIDRAGVIEYLPADFEARTFTSAGLLETLKTLVSAQYPEEKAFLTSLGAALEGFVFRVPEFSPTYVEEPLRKSSVLRGPEIYLRERHFLPVVHFGFFYAGGRITEAPDTAGITEVLVRALLEYRLRTAPMELLRVEAEGTRFFTSNEEDYFGIQLGVPSANVDSVFGRFVAWLRSPPEFAESDISTARRSFAMDLDADCGEYCRNRAEAMQELFPNQPYGHSSLALSRPLRSFSVEQLAEWRTLHIVKILPVFVVTGDVNGTSFLQGLVSRLSDPEFAQTRLPDLRALYAEKQPVVRQWGSRTLLLREGPRAGSDYVEMLDATAMLMEGRAGRVQRKLREANLGFRFGMEQDTFNAGGVLRIELGARPEDADEAVRLAMEELRGSREATVPESRLRSALVETIIRLLVRQQDPGSFLSDTMKAVLAGEPADYAVRYRLNIRQMRMGEIELAIDRYLGERE